VSRNSGALTYQKSQRPVVGLQKNLEMNNYTYLVYTEFHIKDSLMHIGFFTEEYSNSKAMGQHFSEAHTCVVWYLQKYGVWYLQNIFSLKWDFKS
jgi:hypothetical protein